VILIAITLIAAIAIAGFVFRLFVSFTSSAQISAQVTSCTATTDVCVVTLTNSGTSNASATGRTLQIGGKAVPPAATFTAVPVTASGSAPATCGPPTTVVAQTVGSQAVGSFTLSNGATVSFTSTWQ
jgi:hypothetical protein